MWALGTNLFPRSFILHVILCDDIFIFPLVLAQLLMTSCHGNLGHCEFPIIWKSFCVLCHCISNYKESLTLQLSPSLVISLPESTTKCALFHQMQWSWHFNLTTLQKFSKLFSSSLNKCSNSLICFIKKCICIYVYVAHKPRFHPSECAIPHFY
jgi:hypothetical protein